MHNEVGFLFFGLFFALIDIILLHFCDKTDQHAVKPNKRFKLFVCLFVLFFKTMTLKMTESGTGQ